MTPPERLNFASQREASNDSNAVKPGGQNSSNSTSRSASPTPDSLAGSVASEQGNQSSSSVLRNIVAESFQNIQATSASQNPDTSHISQTPQPPLDVDAAGGLFRSTSSSSLESLQSNASSQNSALNLNDLLPDSQYPTPTRSGNNAPVNGEAPITGDTHLFNSSQGSTTTPDSSGSGRRRSGSNGSDFSVESLSHSKTPSESPLLKLSQQPPANTPDKVTGRSFYYAKGPMTQQEIDSMGVSNPSLIYPSSASTFIPEGKIVPEARILRTSTSASETAHQENSDALSELSYVQNNFIGASTSAAALAVAAQNRQSPSPVTRQGGTNTRKIGNKIPSQRPSQRPDFTRTQAAPAVAGNTKAENRPGSSTTKQPYTPSSEQLEDFRRQQEAAASGGYPNLNESQAATLSRQRSAQLYFDQIYGDALPSNWTMNSQEGTYLPDINALRSGLRQVFSSHPKVIRFNPVSESMSVQNAVKVKQTKTSEKRKDLAAENRQRSQSEPAPTKGWNGKFSEESKDATPEDIRKNIDFHSNKYGKKKFPQKYQEKTKERFPGQEESDNPKIGKRQFPMDKDTHSRIFGDNGSETLRPGKRTKETIQNANDKKGVASSKPARRGSISSSEHIAANPTTVTNNKEPLSPSLTTSSSKQARRGPVPLSTIDTPSGSRLAQAPKAVSTASATVNR